VVDIRNGSGSGSGSVSLSFSFLTIGDGVNSGSSPPNADVKILLNVENVAFSVFGGVKVFDGVSSVSKYCSSSSFSLIVGKSRVSGGNWKVDGCAIGVDSTESLKYLFSTGSKMVLLDLDISRSMFFFQIQLTFL